MIVSKKQKEWHQKWWGIIFLIICALVFLYLGLLLYSIISQIENQYLITSQKSDYQFVTPSINIRDFIEKNDSPFYGNKDGEIVIVEFVDFQCPICKAEAPVIERIAQEYNSVKIIFRNFPNPASHPQAFSAAMAAMCANEQNKFWEYHDQLFFTQDDLDNSSLKAIAVSLGLNAENFNNCLDGNRYFAKIQADMEDGLSLNITATPTFYINGNKITGNIPYSAFVAFIEKIKKPVNSQ